MSSSEPFSDRPTVDDLTLQEQVSLLHGDGLWHTRAIPRVGIRSLRLTDGPHGVRVELTDAVGPGPPPTAPATCYPPAVTMASSWDPQLLRDVGAALGAEAAEAGVDVILGPGMNIKRHPLCGRNFEYLSEDPLLSGVLASALVEGIQSAGVGACLKHFAANNREHLRMVVDTVVDERTLREIYLRGFEIAVQAARPHVVMAAYNKVNGTLCSENRTLLTEILRDEWGFEGLVVSDWGGTGDRARGVDAGLDLEMPGTDGLTDAEMLAALDAARLEQAAVRRCAQRVLELPGGYAGPPADRHTADDRDALARRAAAAGSVLLTNNGVLPLPGEASVALIGAFCERPRFQGSGSSAVTPTRVTTALEEMQRRGARVRYVPGYDPERSGRDPALVEEAVRAAKAADVAVVVVGLPESYESEGRDRTDLCLPPQHDHLVRAACAANARTVVVLCNGSPVALPWRDEPAAILEAYLGGQAGGGALVDVLYGDAEPGGRLAETFFATLEDVPSNPWFPGRARQVEYREGVFVGYRHAVTAGTTPAFTFGHGLSYTSFEWGQATHDSDRLTPGGTLLVRVPVTNSGDRRGSEVVQVYLHDRTGVVLRPRRELAGFAKATIEPGATALVEVSVPASRFRFYDVESRSWRTPSGDYAVEIARSSIDIHQCLVVQIEGDTTTSAEAPDHDAVAASDDALRRRLGRDIPPPADPRPFSRETTIGELRGIQSGEALRGVVLRAVLGPAANEPDAMAQAGRLFDEWPLRALVRLAQGGLSWATLDDLVAEVNRSASQ